MGLKDLIDAVLKENIDDIPECIWKSQAEYELSFSCEGNRDLYNKTEYHKLGCDGCKGSNIDCSFYKPLVY